MKTNELLTKLKEIHSDFSIEASPTVGLDAVKFRGTYQFGIPSNEIYDEPTEFYGMELPNGRFFRHRSAREAMAMANELIRKMRNDSKEYEATMGIGEYSDANLRK